MKVSLAQVEKSKKICIFCQSEEVIEFWNPLRHDFTNVNTGREYRQFRFCNSCGRSQAVNPITNDDIVQYNKAVSNGWKFMLMLMGGCMVGVLGLVYGLPKLLELFK